MYEQAIADHPDNPAARDAGMALLRAHLEQQAFADADSVAQYLLTRWQGIRFDLPEVLFLAATAKQGIGERDSARRLCLDLRNLDPGAEISLQAEAMVVDNADAHTSARVTALFGQARQGSATAPALDHDPNLTVDLGALVVELNNGRFFLARFVFLVPDQIAVWELDTKAVPLRDLIARYMANEDPARFVELEASALAATVLAMANEQLVHGHVEQTLLVHSALSTP
ncbi:MAG: hypothetical protein D6E12_05785 [Desulfovibrio sp.]|nr:MAG: hypothetical protein D6E12_05785 [Desulfovibrio sp.]